MAFLLRPRILTFRNYLFQRKLPLIARVVRFGLILFALLFLPSLVFEGIKEMLVLTKGLSGHTERILSSIHFVFASILLFSSALHALNSLYLSPENELLLKAPVSPQSLFAAKLIETSWYGSWVMLLFYFPVVAAVGTVFDFPILFFGAVALELIPLVFVPACIGLISSILFVRLFPARRVKEFLIIGSIGVIILIHFTLQGYETAFRELHGSLPQLLQQKVSPSSLLPKLGLTALAPTHTALSGDVGKTLEVAVLWFVILALALVAAYRCFNDLYFQTFSSDQLPTARILYATRRRISWGLLPPLISGFWSKDTRLFVRDVAQPIQLILFIIVAGLSVYTLSGVSILRAQFPENVPYWNDLLIVIILGFHALVSILYAGRFVYPIMSQEHEMRWILAAAPLDAKQFYRAKLLVAALPALAVLGVFLLVSCFLTDLDPEYLWIAGVGAFLNLWFIVSFALGMGGLLSTGSGDSALTVIASFGNFLFMLVSLLLIPIHWLIALLAGAASGFLFGTTNQEAVRLFVLLWVFLLHLLVLRALFSYLTRKGLQDT